MAKYDFDQIIERRGTGAVKVDALEERFGRADIIPLWVADMDFLSPPSVIQRIVERAQHGIFGYACAEQSYYDSIINWLNDYHYWKIQQDWITFVPGIVKGIAFAINCFVKKDEKVIIQTPVYPPFSSVPRINGREVVTNPLKVVDGKFEIDYSHLESVIDAKCRMLILCNPHNPGGRVWTSEELLKLSNICAKHNILVLSDEIHSDLTLNGNKHIPFASISEQAAMNSLTFMAPSKTFNIAGIVSSYSVIPNPLLRKSFNAFLERAELDSGHIFSYLAAEAAYDGGREWLEEMKKYLWDNICFVKEYLGKHIPQIVPMIPEASFLIWLDCRKLGLTQDELVSLFVNDAKLALNNGLTFGKEGAGFMRLNVGCPRSVLERAMKNLEEAVNNK